MNIHSAKSWFLVERDCKFALFTDYIFVNKGHSVVFYFSYSKGYGDMARI